MFCVKRFYERMCFLIIFLFAVAVRALNRVGTAIAYFGLKLDKHARKHAEQPT